MRKTMENGYLRLTFDSGTNNLVELVNKVTGDNYIKSVRENPILSLWCIRAGIREKFVPSGVSGMKLTEEEERIRLEIEYAYFTNGAERLEAKGRVTLETGGGCEVLLLAALENRDDSYDIAEVLFPHIRGIYLGDTWSDDIMIYPHHAGEKTLNPVEEYAGERYGSFRRANAVYEDGVYCREINYCGLASMMWMYYYDPANGFYLSSNDSSFTVTGMRAETGGAGDPWMGFGMRKHLRIKNGETWESEPYIMAVNCEDWHWGARRYRRWIEPYIMAGGNPAYLKDEYALNQCYNFKKDGRIHNRFDKIPLMFEAGKKFGIRHMFIAGWNRKGFDCNYPEYHPDMELGTPMDLYEGCEDVNKNGGFVTFYINARIFDAGSDFYPTLGREMAVKKPDGGIYSESYGPVDFAVMCPSDPKWRKHLADIACWMVKSYGAAGIYLDQLGSAEPFACFDERHGHGNTGGFNLGYLKLLQELKARLKELNADSFLMTENCGDIYGSYVWGNLTWNAEAYDEYFNVFKYTFPEYVQVNMVNPRQDKPEGERAGVFYRDVERAMLLGSVFWLGITYKFGESDGELKGYVEKALSLRKKMNPYIKSGCFADDEGILFISEGIRASVWKLEDGAVMVAAGNIEGQRDSHILFGPAEGPCSLICEDIDGNSPDLRCSHFGGSLKIELPQSKLLYFVIKESRE